MKCRKHINIIIHIFLDPVTPLSWRVSFSWLQLSKQPVQGWQSGSRRTLLLTSEAAISLWVCYSWLRFSTALISKAGVISQPHCSKIDLVSTEYKSKCSADLGERLSQEVALMREEKEVEGRQTWSHLMNTSLTFVQLPLGIWAGMDVFSMVPITEAHELCMCLCCMSITLLAFQSIKYQKKIMQNILANACEFW